MKMQTDFIPGYCAHCGAKLFRPGSAGELETLSAALDDFHAGETFTCSCGMAFQKGAAPAVHYIGVEMPNSTLTLGRVTACGLEAAKDGGPVVAHDRNAVTCGNCRRVLEAEKGRA